MVVPAAEVSSAFGQDTRQSSLLRGVDRKVVVVLDRDPRTSIRALEGCERRLPVRDVLVACHAVC